MPVMDGYTATRCWREVERDAGDGRHLPIIAMTANAITGDRQSLDAGNGRHAAAGDAMNSSAADRWWRAFRPMAAAATPGRCRSTT